MTTEVKQAVDALHASFQDFKSTQQEFIKEQVKGYVDPLLNEKLNKLNHAITLAEDAKEAAEQAQMLAKKRFDVENSIDSNTEEKQYKTLFQNFLRKGIESFSLQQRNDLDNLAKKSWNSANDAAGGYLVIPEFDKAVTRLIYETSEIRRYATVKTISTDQYEKPAITELAGAYWADRDATFADTSTPSFRRHSIKVYKLVAYPKISQDLLDDAYIDVESELQNSVAQAFDIQENTAFALGDGVGQPRGFLTYPAGTAWGQIEQITNGSASALTYAGIVSLVYSLKDGYSRNAAFMMKRSTVAAARLILDGESRPLWEPGFGSEPATLLGYPIVRANDMPAIASNSLSVAFADWSRAYIIVDRMGTRILRDPYTSQPFVKYTVTRRVGGDVDNFEAIKLLKMTT